MTTGPIEAYLDQLLTHLRGSARDVRRILSETEEQAREAAPPVSSWAAPGVAITGVEFRRVAATA